MTVGDYHVLASLMAKGECLPQIEDLWIANPEVMCPLIVARAPRAWGALVH